MTQSLPKLLDVLEKSKSNWIGDLGYYSSSGGGFGQTSLDYAAGIQHVFQLSTEMVASDHQEVSSFLTLTCL